MNIEPILINPNGSIGFYYSYDGLGSVSTVTNSQGSAVISYAYKAFGELSKMTKSPDAPSNKFRCTAQQYDSTSVAHMRATEL